MRFWDASALAPLVIAEAASAIALEWLREDEEIAIWGMTRVELVSAVERRVRDGTLPASSRQPALQRIARITNDAHEVMDLAAVRIRALPLLARYALRAADAAQLGAALLIAEPEPSSLTMVVLDRRLAAAAEREGLVVVAADS
jgi:predicted nucleic acid-binding protein